MSTLRVMVGSSEFKSIVVLVVGLVVGVVGWFGTSLLSPRSLAVLVATTLGVAKGFAKGKNNQAKPNIKGKIIIVTGGATGIGLQTVRELAKLGATVIIGARGGPARLASAVAAAREGLSPGAAAGISAMSLDLSSFFSIHTFVQEFLAEHTRLHLLINNAGIMACPYSLTSDGLESQMGTNHFGHFLLTNLLLDTLLATRGARVVNLSSLAHTMVPTGLTWPRQNSPTTYDPLVAYADSKLANIYFTTELERRFGSKGLHAYACHPGFVVSELMRHQPWIVQKVFPLLQYFTFKASLEGAQTSLFCALSDEATPGGYHTDARPWITSPAAKDSAKAKWLWEESERITKLK